MAEELQGLLDKIQTEGIEKAESEKSRIIAEAKAEAARIVEDAKKQAEAIVKKAGEEAEVSEAKGAAAIRQAARDVIIALRSDIEARLRKLTADCVGEAMTPELMSQIVLEMVKAYREKNPAGDATVELLLAPKDAERLASLLKGSLLAGLRTNPEITVGNDFASGLQIGFKGTDVFLDFSDDALADVICAFVGPKLAAAIKG